MKRPRILPAILSAMTALLSPLAALAECSAEQVDLRGDWGNARFSVEIADDDAERSRGLMFREELPRSAGMLFIYPEPLRARFWMKNTLLPLDMIFVGPDGVVSSIHSDAVPGDLTPIDGGPGVLVVLEVNAGLAQALGIEVGSQMRHPAFGAGAAWPCDE